MATYSELLQAAESETLRNKVRVACVLAAEAIRTEPSNTQNKANRLKWARSVWSNPSADMQAMVWAVLAQNAAQPLASIVNATDAQVQAAVNAAVDVLAQG